MADISADALIPSGEFRPVTFSGTIQIASGGSGTLDTIPAPPSGQRIRIFGLASSGATQSGITVNANGAAVVTALDLTATSTSAVGGFCVASNVGVGGSSATNGIPYIDSRTAVTIVKVSGSTTAAINYSYAYGF